MLLKYIVNTTAIVRTACVELFVGQSAEIAGEHSSAHVAKVHFIASIVNRSPAPMVGHVIETTYQPIFLGTLLRPLTSPFSRAFF